MRYNDMPVTEPALSKKKVGYFNLPVHSSLSEKQIEN